MTLSIKEKNDLNRKASMAATDLRKKWNINSEPIEDLESLVRSKGFLLLKFPNDKGVSGAFIEKKGRDHNYFCIYLNTFEPYGRINFTLAHEIYHAYYEKSNDAVCLYKKFSDDSIEFTAERFASFFLIPRNTLINVLKAKNINKNYNISFEQIIELEEMFKVSFTAIVYIIDGLKTTSYDFYRPKNIQSFYKYRNSNMWEDLKLKSEKYHCYLNTTEPKFVMPSEFKANIISNLKNSLIDNDEVKDIFNFFNEKM